MKKREHVRKKNESIGGKKKVLLFAALHLLTVASLATGCQDDEQTVSLDLQPKKAYTGAFETVLLSMNLPAAVHPEMVALAANNRLKINDQTSALTEQGDGAMVASAGVEGVELGVEASSGNIVSAGLVTLRNGATVNGFVYTGAKRINFLPRDGTTITEYEGSLTDLSMEPFVKLEFDFQFPSNTAELSNVEGKTSTPTAPAPGYYNQIKMENDSILILSAGVYTVNEFQVEPDATILLDNRRGPIQLIVKNTLNLKGTVSGLMGGGIEWMIIYAGPNDITLFKPFTGTVFAPNAKLVLEKIHDPGKQHRGSFFAKNIEAHQQTDIVHAPSQMWDILCSSYSPESSVSANSYCDILHPKETEPLENELKNKFAIIEYCTWHDAYQKTNMQTDNVSDFKLNQFHWWGYPAIVKETDTDPASDRFSRLSRYRFGSIDNPNNPPNRSLIEKHATDLIAAGVDVIAIDLSNGMHPHVVAGAQALCKVYQTLKEENITTPKITFWIVGKTWVVDDDKPDIVVDVVKVLNEKFFDLVNADGDRMFDDDLWFKIDGKPLLLPRSHNDPDALPKWDNATNREIRKTWGFTGVANRGKRWTTRENVDYPVLDTGASNNSTNRDTEMQAFHNYAWPEQMAVVAATQARHMYNAADTTYMEGRKGRNEGQYFAQQWRDVHHQNPTFVWMSSWNAWGSIYAENAGGHDKMDPPPPGPFFVDFYGREFSSDLEPALDAAGGTDDEYYKKMKTYVKDYKRNVPNFAIRDKVSGDWTFKYYYGAKHLDSQNYTFTFDGLPGGDHYQSFVGDFNGDKRADIGLRDTTTGIWYFAKRNPEQDYFNVDNQENYNWTNTPGAHYQPFTGDFNNDGITDIGMRDPVNGTFYFKHAPNFDSNQTKYTWATGENYQPFIGHFNQDEYLDIGLRNSETGVFYFRPGPYYTSQREFNWGAVGATGDHYVPITGDFDKDGHGDIGLFNKTIGVVYLANGDSTFTFHNFSNYAWEGSTSGNYAVHFHDEY